LSFTLLEFLFLNCWTFSWYNRLSTRYISSTGIDFHDSCINHNRNLNLNSLRRANLILNVHIEAKLHIILLNIEVLSQCDRKLHNSIVGDDFIHEVNIFRIRNAFKHFFFGSLFIGGWCENIALTCRINDILWLNVYSTFRQFNITV